MALIFFRTVSQWSVNVKMEILGLALCVIYSLSFSEAEEPIDNSYQCQQDTYRYDASIKGELTSPFYHERNKYHDGLLCHYEIIAPKGYRIKLTFLDMDIAPSSNCGQDRLLVYSYSRERLGWFCGSELPNPILSLEGENEMYLQFQTDYMVAGKGFRLQYESAPDMTLCKPGYTECRNRNCYENSKKCDGVDDCNDGTDEEECGYPLLLQHRNCGTPKITPDTSSGDNDRMVGGTTAIPNSWPWQVSLQTFETEPNSHFCGGTLLNAQWVLTATHCVLGHTDPKTLKIQIGSHYKFKKTPYEQTRSAIKIIAYPDLQFKKIWSYQEVYDIALVKLNAPVQFNDGVQPACLPKNHWKIPVNSACYATGWGETRGSGGSDELKQMELIIEPFEKCPTINIRNSLCVGKPFISPCQGDSGGPLQCRMGDKWYVFGESSLSTRSNYLSALCAGAEARTIYVNVIAKADWIRDTIRKYN